MQKTISIRKLKNTTIMSKFVEESHEPIFVKKKDYGSMVLMSIDAYEREIDKNQIVEMINESIKDYIQNKDGNGGPLFLDEMKAKYVR